MIIYFGQYHNIDNIKIISYFKAIKKQNDK